MKNIEKALSVIAKFQKKSKDEIKNDYLEPINTIVSKDFFDLYIIGYENGKVYSIDENYNSILIFEELEENVNLNFYDIEYILKDTETPIYIKKEIVDYLNSVLPTPIHLYLSKYGINETLRFLKYYEEVIYFSVFLDGQYVNSFEMIDFYKNILEKVSKLEKKYKDTTKIVTFKLPFLIEVWCTFNYDVLLFIDDNFKFENKKVSILNVKDEFSKYIKYLEILKKYGNI